MKLVNLCKHDVDVVDVAGLPLVKLPPSGKVASIATQQQEKGHLQPEGEMVLIPAFTIRRGEVEGLPPPEEGVVYVTGALVREAVPHRKDVASPGDQLRDEKGRPIGCKGLIFNS